MIQSSNTPPNSGNITLFPWRQSLMLLLFMTVLLGGIYPGLCTLFLQLLVHDNANGSIIRNENGEAVGSQLIGQNFTQPHYFWGRPSATEKTPYTATASKASNLANNNPELLKQVNSRIQILKKYPHPKGPVPVDLVTASGSGLDPHITIAAAYYQAPRIAQLRKLKEEQVTDLIDLYTHKVWIFSSYYVPVLPLNMALDKLESAHD